jgi:hypothetical protein
MKKVDTGPELFKRNKVALITQNGDA